jgi:hypothetical protein
MFWLNLNGTFGKKWRNKWLGLDRNVSLSFD